jgi:hypothetical protein
MLSSWQKSELTCEGPYNDTLCGFYLLNWISFEYNVNMHEHLHIILFKQAYRRNNHRDYMGTLPNIIFGFKHYEQLPETCMDLKRLLNM